MQFVRIVQRLYGLVLAFWWEEFLSTSSIIVVLIQPAGVVEILCDRKAPRGKWW
jgi:succinate dehydrogenase/fumarate reductase cytochrome b subunit